MTAFEHQELKGIIVRNLLVTVISTASIVASVMTTYFGLKNDISDIRNIRETETRINNVRLAILENQVFLLQKEMADIKIKNTESAAAAKSPPASKTTGTYLLSAAR